MSETDQLQVNTNEIKRLMEENRKLRKMLEDRRKSEIKSRAEAKVIRTHSIVTRISRGETYASIAKQLDMNPGTVSCNAFCWLVDNDPMLPPSDWKHPLNIAEWIKTHKERLGL